MTDRQKELTEKATLLKNELIHIYDELIESTPEELESEGCADDEDSLLLTTPFFLETILSIMVQGTSDEKSMAIFNKYNLLDKK